MLSAACSGAGIQGLIGIRGQGCPAAGIPCQGQSHQAKERKRGKSPQLLLSVKEVLSVQLPRQGDHRGGR